MNNDAELVTHVRQLTTKPTSQLSFGGHTKRFAYYASVNANRSDDGLETPDEPLFHDLADGVRRIRFADLQRRTPNDQLRWSSSAPPRFLSDSQHDPDIKRRVRLTTDPIPTIARCATVDRRKPIPSRIFRGSTRLIPDAVLTVSPFYHYNSAGLYRRAERLPRFAARSAQLELRRRLQAAFSITNAASTVSAPASTSFGQHDSYVFGVAVQRRHRLAVPPQSDNVLGATLNLFRWRISSRSPPG